MFEKQFEIKDVTSLKNKLNEALGSNYTAEYEDKKVYIKDKRGRKIFKGVILNNPIGCKLKGNFSSEKTVSIFAIIAVILYIGFLFVSYIIGGQLYDYQIFVMVIGLALIALFKRILLNNTSEIKNIFDEL